MRTKQQNGYFAKVIINVRLSGHKFLILCFSFSDFRNPEFNLFCLAKPNRNEVNFYIEVLKSARRLNQIQSEESK